MLTVFITKNGDILFTYPDITLTRGDYVKRNGKTYMIIKKVFVADGGFYEMTLSETQEGQR